MLSQAPQIPAGVPGKEKAAPIFFSLSDNTEVAPSENVPTRRTTIALPTSDPRQNQNKLPSVPLTVTVKEDGSIVTAVRQKPVTPKIEKKETIPQPILAGENTLGTGLDLPRPKALPKAVSEPKQMPVLPKTAKSITPSGKSILSTTSPSSSNEHQKLSVAKVKEFMPNHVPHQGLEP